LNNKDLLSGDHVPLPVFGIVNGDLIYVHLPADYVFEGTSSAAGGNDSTSSRKKTPDQVTKIDNATNASTSEQCKMETECSYNKSADTSPESSLQDVNDGSLNNVNDVLSEIDAEDYAKVTEVEELSAKEVNNYLQQAMLIRDTAGDHIPHSLQTALESTQPHTEHHYVFVVIHILVLETGFMLQVFM
jgi:F-box protein 7